MKATLVSVDLTFSFDSWMHTILRYSPEYPIVFSHIEYDMM